MQRWRMWHFCRALRLRFCFRFLFRINCFRFLFRINYKELSVPFETLGAIVKDEGSFTSLVDNDCMLGLTFGLLILNDDFCSRGKLFIIDFLFRPFFFDLCIRLFMFFEALFKGIIVDSLVCFGSCHSTCSLPSA